MTESIRLSVRAKLALSYAAVVVISGSALIMVAFVFLIRYVPTGSLIVEDGGWAPNRSNLIEAFVPRAIAVLIGLIVIGLAGGWLLAGRMLRPLHSIEHAARLAAEGSLSHRIASAGPLDEFRRVADTFDTMLSRIERNVGEQQRFAANASHELRTPLAISRTVIEVARADSDRNVDTVLAELDSMNSRAIQLTEALLLLARIERDPIRTAPVDLSLVVDDTVAALGPLAERSQVAVRTSIARASVIGAPLLIEQLVANLITNAIVHNQVEHPVVWVEVRPIRDDRVRLTVANTGALLDHDQVAQFTEPFRRGAGRVRIVEDHHVGAGLGLAIIDSIVRAHQAELILVPRSGGGLIAEVVFPRRDSRRASSPALAPVLV